MRIPTSQNRSRLGFDMTPMIDVVFNLIIFFLLSNHLARQEEQLDLDLPTAATGQNPDVRTGKRRVVLQVSPQGQVAVGGRSLAAGELEAALAEEQARAAGGIEVRIRADRGVAYRHVESLLGACVRLGIGDVTFAVTPDRD